MIDRATPTPRSRPLALAALLASLALLLLAGCGDDESATTSASDQAVGSTETAQTDEETSTATDDEITEETTEETSTAEDGALPAGDLSVTESTMFTSPTGNIGCVIEPLAVRCDISERSWDPPKAPKDCELDFGQGIELTTGATAEFVCAGDTALSSAEPVPYGSSISAGLLICESAESGISCTDGETGRGFTISRESYEIY